MNFRTLVSNYVHVLFMWKDNRWTSLNSLFLSEFTRLHKDSIGKHIKNNENRGKKKGEGGREFLYTACMYSITLHNSNMIYHQYLPFSRKEFFHHLNYPWAMTHISYITFSLSKEKLTVTSSRSITKSSFQCHKSLLILIIYW